LAAVFGLRITQTCDASARRCRDARRLGRGGDSRLFARPPGRVL